MKNTTLIIACGALAREITQLARLNQWSGISVQCVPAKIHNTPEQIPAAVGQIIRRARAHYAGIFVAFGDCGTGGKLDALLESEKIERLPGAHCYEFYAGSETFNNMMNDEPGTFFLTDFLARHFERLIFEELGINKHPELREMYFANYQRVVYLAQTQNEELQCRARNAAAALGLDYEYRPTGYGDLQTTLARVNESIVQWQS